MEEGLSPPRLPIPPPGLRLNHSCRLGILSRLNRCWEVRAQASILRPVMKCLMGMEATAITDDDIATLHRDGVVCLRGVIPTEFLAAADAALAEAMAQCVDLSAMADALSPSADRSVDLGASPKRGRFYAGIDHWRTLEAFRALACDSPLPSLVGALFGSGGVWLYEDSVLIKEPGAAEKTSWHQDLPYFHVAGEQLCTTWAPLDHVTPDSGAVRFVRGSHLDTTVYQPNLFVTDMPIPGTTGSPVPITNDDDPRIITFETFPGNVTVHHARTIHGAGGNSTARPRRAVSIRYCGDDARVHPRSGAPMKDFQHALIDGDSVSVGYPRVR
jgi:ectoine hydroxylase-related dioxygenase (phytanoyl-CoA dioxygenase family)